jgi:molybdenum cofactor cytidylyltransferase
MVGIVLAGGSSTRAKVNKLLLEVDRKPLICHTINTISPFVDKVVVVTGKYHDELCKVITNAEIVFNSNHEKGMFSSVLAGVKAALGNNVLLIPGDITNVSGASIRALVMGTKAIRIPSCNGITGHPVYLSKEILDELTKEPVNSKLCDFIAKHNNETEIIEVNDKFINFDIDTIEDYNRLRKEFTL